MTIYALQHTLWKYSTSCSHIWRAPFLQDRTNAGGRGCIREEEPELCEYPFRTARQSCPCGLACVMGLGIQPGGARRGANQGSCWCVRLDNPKGMKSLCHCKQV